MKQLIIILLSVLLSEYAGAQVKPEVIASAGGLGTSPGLSVSWTLGETLIPTFVAQDGSITLTHGFQQLLVVTVVEENITTSVLVKIYPNPASDKIIIEFEEPLDEEVSIIILDGKGRPVKRDMIEVSMTDKLINMQDVPAGMYFLRLIKGKSVNVYKVVKL